MFTCISSLPYHLCTNASKKLSFPQKIVILEENYFNVTNIIVGSGKYGRYLQNPLLVALQLILMELGVGPWLNVLLFKLGPHQLLLKGDNVINYIIQHE